MNYEEHISKSYDQIKSIKIDEEIINQLKSLNEDNSNNYPEKNFFNDFLVHSLHKGNLSLAKHCIDFGADPEVDNGVLLKKAIKALNYEKVKVLTSQNNVDLSKYYELQDDWLPTKKNETDYKNYPWRQAQKRQSEKSKINEPAKVKGRTLKEKNPLMLKAIEKGELDTIVKLKSEGVNMHADNDYYLQFAAKHNNAQLVDYFLKEGCDPSLHNGQSVVYAFSKSNFSLFKKLAIHGGLQNKVLEEAFKKELKYHNDLLNNEIAQEHKNIEFNNFLYELHFSYLTGNQRKSKVEEKPVQLIQEDAVFEPKAVASPFGFLMAQPTSMHGDKKKKKTTERVAKPKEQIMSPFDKVKVVQEKYANIDVEIQFKEAAKTDEIVVDKEIAGKEVVNLEGKTITRKELQKSWDEELILSFARCDSINMRKLMGKFLSDHQLNFELLNASNITIRRIPTQIMNNQWDMTPHRFVCQHLPQLSELLFKQKMSDIPDNLDFYTQKIRELKINTIGEGIDKKSSVVKEKRELRYNEEVFAKTLMAQQNNNSVEMLKRNNAWNKVK